MRVLTQQQQQAALRLTNDQLFVSDATQRSPNFSNQATTFLEKKTDLRVPIQRRRFLMMMAERKIELFNRSSTRN